MNFVLAFILCSAVERACLPPVEWPKKFNDHYDCMIAGYEESLKKLNKIGREEVNQNGLFIKFFCVKNKRSQGT